MTTLPTWDPTSLFPGLEAPEFQQAFDRAIADLNVLEEAFDRLDIRAGGSTENAAAKLEQVVAQWNALQEQLVTLRGFVQMYVTTDSRNTVAQGRSSELNNRTVRLSQLSTRLSAWAGNLDLEAVLAEAPGLKDYALMLRKQQVAAQHQMSPQEEELASLLNLSGGSAWAKLHGNVTSQLEVPYGPEGQRLPMPAVRNLASDPDPAVREAAYRAELAAWQSVEVPLAAALNGIKGEVNTLNRRRGWQDSVEPTLLQNSIDRETLAAMQAACVESFPDFRRYFRAKARLLGKERLAFYDLFAPVGKSSRNWSYPEATRFVVEQFRTYSDRLADYAQRAFDEGWIDVGPRPGKRDGAFCMRVRGGESRILMNFDENLDSVSTLAHELGHGYHNLCLEGRPSLLKNNPMTLAETASIFCETIVVNAALQDARGDERLYILETQLQGQAQVVVDIHSRFLFENGVFAAREARDLSVAELKERMLEAQRATYGDGLEETLLHPYMWAVKSHYYSTGLSYYNYPYTFGLLFGLGLYARYLQDPGTFRAQYDELLSSTTLEDAASLGARFGIDTRSQAFWRSSLDVIRGQIDEYVRLVDAATPA
ncbi:pepF/M3 family oligoendopeptidase [Deinobacterium chartae]|uniref:PepF/M3 family oligoendopeptidase n=1 Tax=Deinobacterium chartae TaxID=521158 RepID=A0A841I047_9DEIO|nr:M3 family oligoendopeptidase [Deinobacterium chartae]MBB6098563.1 pepF/M3 family oligoendopeptidase [Deinobacterium chartae]